MRIQWKKERLFAIMDVVTYQRKGFYMRKKEICEAYAAHRKDIMDAARRGLMRWHTPIRGYTDIKEVEADERYQFLTQSWQAVKDDQIHPEEDIVDNGNEVVFIQNDWFYRYWILKKKYNEGDTEWTL